ncbi:MAG: stage V sporulation protein AC [Oscillospiraceae bacterium]|nr:stage V sporulation protein AC [Oscillospiraceae bacterium]
MLKMSQKEYKAYVKRQSPNSPIWKNILNAFWTGGLICVIGQLIQNGYTALGLAQQNAGTATSISMVFLGALLTGLSVYDNIAKLAGAGTVVPITGFANSIVAPAMEFKTESITLGTCAKMFVIAGPVIVFGTVASAIYGVIYWLTLVL